MTNKPCPKCGGEIDEDLEDAALIILSLSYVRHYDDKPPPDFMPRQDALVWHARFLAERAIHKCGHEEKANP